MRLAIQCEDRIGMVHEVLKLFAPHRIDMRLIEVDTARRCLYIGFPDIKFDSLQQLLAAIRRLEGVEDVKLVRFSSSEREKNTLAQILEALPDGVIAIDLKGNVTMATELAAKDLGVSLGELMNKPLNLFIKAINFSKLSGADMKRGITKRIRVHRKSLLMELQPIKVSTEKEDICAGAVIHLKSETRIDRQSERFRYGANEFKLEQYFQSDMVLSSTMGACLIQSKRFAMLNTPLMISGEIGSGKNSILNSIIEYWKSHGYEEAQVHKRAAVSFQTQADLQSFLLASGWLIIEGIEGLNDTAQAQLAHWIETSKFIVEDDHVYRRLVVLTSFSSHYFREESSFSYELYLQLSQQNIDVPSLRDRLDDIEGVANEIVKQVCGHLRVDSVSLSSSAVTALKMYDWPGNIAELKGVLYSAVASTERSELVAEDFNLFSSSKGRQLELVDNSLDKTIKEWEAELLRKLYPQYPSTRKLASALGLSHSAVANKLRDYAIGK
ncbi:TyrR/PhhR family helix-turn-helix DNA-binding protein [Marinomonas mediterranea]|uniref:TyrR/PhhR family helix-turn-helix DNA-binding protein n=1 Tax=Marinomonas mediterranea TaxID=119864 RepID=UPI002349B2CC|nr:TyrR/PhhR family helix-turn-helix DNA-binding protein [Marinomonas mediterranea]WCN09680.1 PAS domain-containing protein [Marinomonas mediterranea]